MTQESYDDYVDSLLAETVAANDPDAYVRLGNAGMLDKSVYSDPDRYAAYLVQAQQRVLANNDPLADLGSLLEEHPTLSPETAVTDRLLVGLNPNTDTYRQLAELDHTRSRQQEEARAAAEAQRAQAARDNSDNGIQWWDPAQAFTRYGFALAASPFQMIESAATNGVAEIRGFLTGEDVDTDFLGALSQNDLTAIVDTMIAASRGEVDYDDGGGWFIGGTVADTFDMYDNLAVQDPYTVANADQPTQSTSLGREWVGLWGLDPDEGGGQVVKGIVNGVALAAEMVVAPNPAAFSRTGRVATASTRQLFKTDGGSFAERVTSAKQAASEARMTREDYFAAATESGFRARLSDEALANLHAQRAALSDLNDDVRTAVNESGFGEDLLARELQRVEATHEELVQAARDAGDTDALTDALAARQAELDAVSEAHAARITDFADAIAHGDTAASMMVRNSNLTVQMLEEAGAGALREAKAARPRLVEAANTLNGLHAGMKVDGIARHADEALSTAVVKVGAGRQFSEALKANAARLRAKDELAAQQDEAVAALARADEAVEAAKARHVEDPTPENARALARAENAAKRARGNASQFDRPLRVADEGPAARRAAKDAQPVARAADSANARVDLNAAKIARLEARAKQVDAVVAELEKRLAAIDFTRRDQIVEMARASMSDWTRANKVELPEGNNLDEFKQILDAQTGRYADPFSGREFIDQDRAVQMLYGKGFEAHHRMLAAIDDPADIYFLSGRKYRGGLAKDLAKASTADEVKTVLHKAIADGSYRKPLSNKRRARMARMARIEGTRVTVDEAQSTFQRIVRGVDPAVAWVDNALTSRSPTGYRLTVKDPDSVADAIADSFDFVGREFYVRGAKQKAKVAEAFGKDWADLKHVAVRRIIEAESPQEIRKAYYTALEDMWVATAKIHGFDADHELTSVARDAFRAVVKSEAEHRAYDVDVIANLERAAGVEDIPPSLVPDELASDEAKAAINAMSGRSATNEAEMTDTLLMPDPREMQRVFALGAKAFGWRGDVGRALDTFSDFWKSMVIAWRGTYIVRNTFIEGAVRGFGKGHPNALTSPAALTTAVVSRRGSKTYKDLVNAKVYADRDARGELFIKGVTEDSPEESLLMAQTESDIVREIYTRGSAYGDPNTMTGSQYAMRGLDPISDQSDKRFVNGVAAQLMRWQGDPIVGRLMRAMAGAPSREMSIFQRKVGTDSEQALLLWLQATPDGQKAWRNVVDAADPAVWPNLDLSESAMRRYLLDDGPNSMKSRVRAHVNDDMTLLRDVATKGEFSPTLRPGERSMEDVQARLGSLATRIRADHAEALAAGKFPVARTTAPTFEKKTPKGLLQRYMDFTSNTFFRFAAQVESEYMRIPEYGFSYWDHIATLAPYLNKYDAAKALAAAEETLGMKNRVGGGYQKVSGTWRAQTLRKIREGAKQTSDDAVYTLDEASLLAARKATQDVDELFYDAAKRNQWAHALRFAFPFVQPTYNTLIKWADLLVVKNPQRLYKAQEMGRALTEPGTEQVYDWLGLEEGRDYQEGQGFIFTNDFGQPSIALPVMGAGIRLLAEALTVGQFDMAGPVGSSQALQANNVALQTAGRNFAVTFLPSFGPVVQVPAAVLTDTDLYLQNAPSWAQEWLFPSKTPDHQPGGVTGRLPSWTQALGAFVANKIGSDALIETQARYAGPILNQLASTGEYDLTDPAELERLTRDAVAQSSTVQFSRWLSNQVLGGGQVLDFYSQTKDGSWVPQAHMYDQLAQALNETGGDYNASMEMLADRFGKYPLMAVLGARSTRNTEEAFAYVRKNPSLARAHPDHVGLFFPDGAYSVLMAAWSANHSGADDKPDYESTLDASNTLFARLERMEVERKVEAGEITPTEGDAALDAISDKYELVRASFTIGGPGDIAVIERMVDESLEDLGPAGAAADEWLTAYRAAIDHMKAYRDVPENSPFAAEAATPWREPLLQLGEELVAETPEFRRVWGLFKGELS